MIRVLLVDDHPVVRSGYRRLLEQAGDIKVTAEAGYVKEAYAAEQAAASDVCITDLSLPDASGLELMRKLIARDSKAKVMIFSMYDSVQLIRRALDGGACGFISKHATPDDLVTAVRTVHAGQRYLSSGISQSLLNYANQGDTELLGTLTQREFEIFRLLAEGQAPGDCARMLNLSLKTIANNQSRIKEKLGVSTTAALVHLALRNNVMSSGDI